MLNRVPSHARWQLIFLVSAFFIHGLLLYQATIQQQERWHIENGWLENLQVLYLTLAMVTFALSARTFSDRHRRLFYFLAIVAFLFILREVEFGDFPIPQWMKFMLAGDGRALFYLTAMALLLKQSEQLQKFWQQRQVYMRMALCRYLVASGGILLAFSLTLDRQIFEVRHFQLWEEASEAIAYTLFWGAAIFGGSGIKNQYPESTVNPPGEAVSEDAQDGVQEGESEIESMFTIVRRVLPSHKQNR